MQIRSLVLGLLLSVSSALNAQYTVRIIPTDTLPIDSTKPMVFEYNPSPVYGEWLRRIVDCEKLQMPSDVELEQLRFYVVNSVAFKIDNNPQRLAGVVFNKDHLVFLAAPYVYDYSIVAHELLHFVLWYNYGAEFDIGSLNVHPIKYFATCGMHPF